MLRGWTARRDCATLLASFPSVRRMIRTPAARGIALMLASMAAFAAADTLVKLSTAALSAPQVMVLLLGGGLIGFAAMALAEGRALFDARALGPVFLVRYASEVAGMVGMVMALALVPLSTVGAITQAAPIIATIGAVLFLGESVGWRRWSAIGAGFAGVVLIVRPGGAGFDLSVLWAVLALVALAVRDLTTPLVPRDMASSTLAVCTMSVAVPFAVAWVLATGEPVIAPDTDWRIAVPMIVLGSVGYVLLIASLRTADVSIVMPFRYARVLFLLALGIAVFGERPDGWVLAGAALVVASGLYMLWRRRVVDAD